MATVNLDKAVIESAARGFVKRADVLTAFTVVVPAAPVTKGEVVKIPFNTGSVSSVFAYSTGYTGNTQDVSGKSATMNLHLFQPIRATDADLIQWNAATVANVFKSAGEQLMADIVSASIASTVTATNFTQVAGYVAGQFTSSLALADLKGKSVNWRATDGKHIIATSTLITPLYNNATYVNWQNINSIAAIQRGETENQDIFGFKLHEYGNTLLPGPTTSGSAGLFLAPSAVGIAIGSLNPPDSQRTTRYEQITVPNANGLSFGYREFYDDNLGTTVRVLECLVGVTVLDNTALYWIPST